MRKVKRKRAHPLCVMLTDAERESLNATVESTGCSIREIVARGLAMQASKPLGKWTVQIVIVDTHGKLPKQVIERFDDEDTEMVFKLCQVGGGQIYYDGRNAFVNKPVADPIQRKLVYYVELFERLDA